MGANAHDMVGDYADQFQGDCIVEIGCGHNSTPILYDIAKNNGQTFIGVDPAVSTFGQVDGKDLPGFIQVKDKYGQDYMVDDFPKLNMKISAAYLDNFDWIWSPKQYRETGGPIEIHRQVVAYGYAGVVMNNFNSTVVHLKQVIEIEKYAANNCVILFDDTWVDHNQDSYVGKGSAGIFYLLAKGWKIVYQHGVNEEWNPAVMLQKQ